MAGLAYGWATDSTVLRADQHGVREISSPAGRGHAQGPGSQVHGNGAVADQPMSRVMKTEFGSRL